MLVIAKLEFLDRSGESFLIFPVFIYDLIVSGLEVAIGDPVPVVPPNPLGPVFVLRIRLPPRPLRVTILGLGMLFLVLVFGIRTSCRGRSILASARDPDADLGKDLKLLFLVGSFSPLNRGLAGRFGVFGTVGSVLYLDIAFEVLGVT